MVFVNLIFFVWNLELLIGNLDREFRTRIWIENSNRELRIRNPKCWIKNLKPKNYEIAYVKWRNFNSCPSINQSIENQLIPFWISERCSVSFSSLNHFFFTAERWSPTECMCVVRTFHSIAATVNEQKKPFRSKL